MTARITRWAPAPDLFRDRMSRLFDQTFADFISPLAETEEVSSRTWHPAVDIKESENNLTIFAELPGLSREDIGITLEDRVLTVSGERRFEKEAKDETFHRIERSYGAFTRSFSLPTNVNVEEVEASFKDGVLALTLPKVEEAKPRQISIG